MGASTATKRHNGKLEKSYKRATGAKDERKGPMVQPGAIVKTAFLLIGLKAFNTHVEDTHGVSPWSEAKRCVVGGVQKMRRTLSRLIAGRPGGGGNGGRGNVGSKSSGSKGSGGKNFKGTGKKLGKR